MKALFSIFVVSLMTASSFGNTQPEPIVFSDDEVPQYRVIDCEGKKYLVLDRSRSENQAGSATELRAKAEGEK